MVYYKKISELLETATVNPDLKKLAYTNYDQKLLKELIAQKESYNNTRDTGDAEWQLNNYYSTRPVIVDSSTETIISGYFHLAVAQEFGLEEIPVAYVKCPTMDQQVDYVLEEIGTRKKLSGADIYQIVEFMDTRVMTRGGGKKMKVSSDTNAEGTTTDTYQAIAEKINVGRATVHRAFVIVDAVKKGNTSYKEAILKDNATIYSQYALLKGDSTGSGTPKPELNLSHINLFKKNHEQKKGDLTKAITAGNIYDLAIDKLPPAMQKEFKKLGGNLEFKVVVVEKKTKTEGEK